jgi:ribosomal protein S18 acetylase RimI-like enzyme
VKKQTETLWMTVQIKLLRPGDESLLSNTAPEVFDDAIDVDATREFLANPLHHLVVAVDGDLVVGFVSAIHYLHPDKPRPEMWINEVGVAPTHRVRGLGTAMLDAMLGEGQRIGCSEAWVLTERSNTAAMRLYSLTGGTQDRTDSLMFTFRLEPEAQVRKPE